ncbi:MAG TPA: phospholipid carrier-dependent glycosyltransferase [Methanoculleus sp.]|nr:phospholipid carrier-dependent glycosyltransferase [Methanoculleus sp.]
MAKKDKNRNIQEHQSKQKNMGNNHSKDHPEKKKTEEITNMAKLLSFESIKKQILHDRCLLILVALTIFAGILRFYHLGFNSIWLDEACTLDFARNSLSGIFDLIDQGEVNPPLFYYLEHFMLSFGEGETVLRFVPALFGTLTVPAIYILGKEALNQKNGIIAAGLLAFSSYHIFYSQEARAYTIMLFFFTIALIFYLQSLKENDIKCWILFGAFSALAIWSHFFVIFGIGIIFFHALVVGFKNYLQSPKSLVPWLAGLAAFAIIASPMLYAGISVLINRIATPPT